jgi:hypothetical protein
MSPYQNHATMQGHIAQWQASELTQAAYCNEHGIKPHTDVASLKPLLEVVRSVS